MAREWATDVSDGTGATTAQSDHPCHSPRPAMRWSRIGNIAARLALSTWAHQHSNNALKGLFYLQYRKLNISIRLTF